MLRKERENMPTITVESLETSSNKENKENGDWSVSCAPGTADPCCASLHDQVC